VIGKKGQKNSLFIKGWTQWCSCSLVDYVSHIRSINAISYFHISLF